MREAIVLLFLAIYSSKAVPLKWWGNSNSDYCLSWRVAVEANNMRAWRTVPPECLSHVKAYMVGGQYQRDVAVVVDTIFAYVDTIAPSGDGLDAWVLDIDDTCISNLLYYSGKRYGCEPFDPVGFKAWAVMGGCPAIPDVLRLFNKLIQAGFKVFLITGRDEQTLAPPTILNLYAQGFIGYHGLILRSGAYKGVSASTYKSEMRKQLVVDEGYRIWGNVGDQWTDLLGDYAGNRTFKLPNPIQHHAWKHTTINTPRLNWPAYSHLTKVSASSISPDLVPHSPSSGKQHLEPFCSSSSVVAIHPHMNCCPQTLHSSTVAAQNTALEPLAEHSGQHDYIPLEIVFDSLTICTAFCHAHSAFDDGPAHSSCKTVILVHYATVGICRASKVHMC